MNITLVISWFVLFFIFTLITSGIFLNTNFKITFLSKKYLLSGGLITTLTVIALIILSPIIDHTNALDSVLVKSGLIEYPADSIILGWFHFPNLLNDILTYAVFLGLSPEFLSLVITLTGLVLWFFAYYLTAKSFGISHVTSLAASFSLTYFNPMLQLFSHVFGYQVPWSGNSTYGMLGLALVAYGMSLCLVGRFWPSLIITVLVLLVSPINGLVLACVLVMIGLQALKIGDRTLSRDFIVWLTVILIIISLSALKVSSYRHGYGAIDFETFNTYLVDWDGHRNPSIYKIPGALVILIIITAITGATLSKSPLLRKKLTSTGPRRNIALFAISVSTLLPLAYLAVDTVLFFLNQNRNQADVLFIQEMPLRLTSISGFVIVVIAFCLTEIIVNTKTYSHINQYVLNYLSQKVAILLSAFAACMFMALSYYFVMGFQPRETLLSILFNPNRGLKSFVTVAQPDELGRQIRKFSEAGANLTIVAPGLSRQIFWGARVPILLQTENGIDFVGYLPQLADDVKILIQEGYGLDFSSSSKLPRCGCIPENPKIKEAWENRTTDEWRSFSNKFGVHFVAAPVDWTLSIPDIARENGLAVYKIR